MWAGAPTTLAVHREEVIPKVYDRLVSWLMTLTPLDHLSPPLDHVLPAAFPRIVVVCEGHKGQCAIPDLVERTLSL